MRVMLTSCGLETEQLKEQFLKILGVKPADMTKITKPSELNKPVCGE